MWLSLQRRCRRPGGCHQIAPVCANMPSGHPLPPAMASAPTLPWEGPLRGQNGRVLSVNAAGAQRPSSRPSARADTWVGQSMRWRACTAQGRSSTSPSANPSRNDASDFGPSRSGGDARRCETSAYLLVDDVSVEELDLAVDLGPILHAVQWQASCCWIAT